jgi:hypothetical protein
MPASYTVSTTTPGAGSQTVSEITSNLYVGGPATFDYVVLAYTGTVWQFVIYENDDTSSPFYPAKTFQQVTAGTDPVGDYGLLVNGVPDTSEGSGSVTL